MSSADSSLAHSPAHSPPPASPTLSQSSTAASFSMVSDEEAAMRKPPPPAPSKGLHPALHITNWIFFSNITILFNKWILDTAGFRYLAFIQMLKSAAPVAVLFASWAWRVADPNVAAFVNILVIVAGVALASLGEIQFSLTGFLYQIGGIAFEAVRIVMIQVMLSGQGLNMDPLVGLYYYAPVCAAMNVIVALFTEIPRFHWDDLAKVGSAMLFLNALIAFLLNIASVLIGKTSGLVMTLSGIFKNIPLILVSIIIWHTKITLIQGVGYSIALAGLIYYSVGYDQLAKGSQAAAAWAAATLGPSPSSLHARRIILLGILGLSSLLVLIVALRRYDARTTYQQPSSERNEDFWILAGKKRKHESVEEKW